MNKSPLTKVLLGVLTLIALWSLVLCYSYISKTRELRMLNPQAVAAQIGFFQQKANALVADVVEYGKKNPDINPILDSIRPKSNSTATATAPKSATK